MKYILTKISPYANTFVAELTFRGYNEAFVYEIVIPTNTDISVNDIIKKGYKTVSEIVDLYRLLDDDIDELMPDYSPDNFIHKCVFEIQDEVGFMADIHEVEYYYYDSNGIKYSVKKFDE